MRRLFVPALLAVTLPCCAVRAAGIPPLLARPSAGQQLAALQQKIEDKIDHGAKTEAELADELKQLDALLTEHKGDQSEPVAKILELKMELYVNIFLQPEKGIELLQQLKAGFPATPEAKQADAAIEALRKQIEAEKVARPLKPGVMFPAFADKAIKDLDGQPLSLDRFKGKVVLIDFWATWCEPCLIELPNVVATYHNHHAEGFEIIGVSLDREGDRDKLAAFVKKNDMAWPQYYDGKFWDNKLVLQYGVREIPSSYLLDRNGKIIARDLRGIELELAVASTLKK